MQLLIKDIDYQGVAAHIVDTHGNPLCHINIKRSLWHIQEQPERNIVICYHCRRIHEKAMHVKEVSNTSF